MNCKNLEALAIQLLGQLIRKMERHVTNQTHQSFGSLQPHLDAAKEALERKRYLDPLYYVAVPRWLGEDGITALEKDIWDLALKIDNTVIELCGGVDFVNSMRIKHNESLVHAKAKAIK